jgi:hypothetical protein
LRSSRAGAADEPPSPKRSQTKRPRLSPERLQNSHTSGKWCSLRAGTGAAAPSTAIMLGDLYDRRSCPSAQLARTPCRSFSLLIPHSEVS